MVVLYCYINPPSANNVLISGHLAVYCLDLVTVLILRMVQTPNDSICFVIKARAIVSVGSFIVCS